MDHDENSERIQQDLKAYDAYQASQRASDIKPMTSFNQLIGMDDTSMS